MRFPKEFAEGQWWADSDRVNRVGVSTGEWRKDPETGGIQLEIKWRGEKSTWVSKQRIRPEWRGYVYLGTEEPPEIVTADWLRCVGGTEFIVLFEDSLTWSSDNSETISGNSCVIPQCLSTDDEWREMMDQEALVEDINPPRIPISKMIRALKKANKWDDLLEEALFDAESRRD